MFDTNDTDHSHVEPGSTDVGPVMSAAVRRIAPVWKLEDFVAVNPYLGMVDLGIDDAAALLHRAAGARSTSPIRHRLEQLDGGIITRRDVADALAAARAHSSVDVDRFIAEARAARELDGDRPALTLASSVQGPGGLDLDRFMVERLGAWAAAFHDDGQASWRSAERGGGIFASWRAEAMVDRTPDLMGLRGFRSAIAALPADHGAAAASMLSDSGLSAELLELYLQALLLRTPGWSAVAARLDWEAALRGGDGDHLLQWLAVLVCWDHAAAAAVGTPTTAATWRECLADRARHSSTGLSIALVLQDARDRSARRELAGRLEAASRPVSVAAHDIRAQLVCCIDVRSEVLRRHLERVAPDVETLGFAGFFGAAVEVVPLGHDHAVAQCPALVAPAHTLHESLDDPDRSDRAVRSRRLRHQLRAAWKQFRTGAVSCYGFVSPVGLLYAPKLVSDAAGLTRPVPEPGTAELPRWAGPGLTPAPDGRVAEVPLDARVAIAAGALRGMSLTQGLAPLLVLVGHGATTVNNPHAAALECGACGGHGGATNARIVAAMLNDPEVRGELVERGIEVPATTHVVAAVHDTTTDQVTLLDVDRIPATHRDAVERLGSDLHDAGSRVVAERARRFAPTVRDAADEARRRSRDWAQVRPEWGLAGCRAFVAAPRSRTRELDLGGQAFLHSYDWRRDEGLAVLEQIMSAPMVVASWITLQYYASTVDPELFGAGDKTMHNVVGRMGVLEGCGGDLRLGLAQQSVRDGSVLQHEPLRLAVMIEAPTWALDEVMDRNQAVAHLVTNGWVLLHAIDPEDGRVQGRGSDGTWTPVAAGPVGPAGEDSELEVVSRPVGPLDRGARGPDVVDVVG
ncbi:MAG: YbcC family protein [Microthrixaceae bacterium]